MLHLQKLAVGVRDLAHLRALQAARAKTDPPLRHHTRTRPRRADEIEAGGSIFWVIAGVLQARQRVRQLQAGIWDDGSPATAIVLDPTLVPVMPRAMRPFQGWRYLTPDDAPPDVATAALAGEGAMPPELLRHLREIGLL